MQGSGIGRVREFERTDIPAVAALRRQLFRSSDRGSARELESYLDQLFFHGPISGSHLPSFVFEDTNGSLGGFLGVVPRQMLFGGRTVRAAVGTQLMVAPHCRGLAARKLVRAFIQGPQDIAISDSANDAARTIWSSVGGRTSLAYSMFWTRALRPVRYATTRVARNVASRALVYAAKPICALADAAIAPPSRWIPARMRETVTEPLDTVRHLPELSEILERWELRPRYTAESFAWVLGHVSDKRRFGELQRVVIRDASRQAIGWFMYCLNRGGVSTVVQVAAVKGATEIVLARLMEHASRNGVIALTGRFDPSTAQELTAAGATFRREGPWLLYHSRHGGVERAIESGDAFISRLEGEWWMSF